MRRFPARSGSGDMGKVGETLEEVEPHPMVLGIGARVVGYGGSTEEGGRRWRGLDGEGVPVVEGGREGAGKLRGVTVVLARGSEWAEELQRGGSTAVSSSPAFKVERRRVLGCGNAEQAKERVEWLAGAFVRLVRALGEGGGLSLGRATATARWRPCGGSGRRGEGRGHQREAKGGGEARERRVGASAKQRGPAGSPRRAGGAAQWRRQPALKNRAGSLAGGRGKGPKCNF